MKRFSGCLFLVGMFVWLGTCVGREMTAGYVEIPPVVDGRLDDSCWKAGEWQSGFTRLEKNGAVEQEQTRFKVVTDRNGIFLAVDCDAAVVNPKERVNGGNIFKDDCIEIFLAPHEQIPPDPMMWEYYQFVVNAANCRFELHSQASVGDRNWNGPWKSATGRTASGWQAEIFIPYGTIQKPAGKQWHLNIGRENPRTAISTWNPMDYYRILTKFAALRGLRIDASRFAGELKETRIRCSSSEDGRKVEYSGEFHCRPDARYMMHCMILENGRRMDFASMTVQADNAGKADFVFPIRFGQAGTFIFRLAVYDGNGLVFFQDSPQVLDFAPFTVRMQRRYRPEVICSRQRDKKVAFSCDFLLPEKQYRRCDIQVSVRNKEGRVFFSEKRRVAGQSEKFVFDAAGFPYGRYETEVLVREGGKQLGRIVTPLVVAEPLNSEVWLDDQMRLVINGKTTFPVGFMGHLHRNGFDCMKGSGCNVGHCYHNYPVEQAREFLDMAHRQNMKIMFYPYLGIRTGTEKPFTAKQWQGMKEYVDALKNHPALLGWFAFDEPYAAGWIANLKETYKKLREWDPVHPVFGDTNRAPMCVQIGGFTDVIMLDYYPCPRKGEGNERPLPTIYNGMQLMQRELKSNGIWNIPQAFDYDQYYKEPSPYRAPTFKEARCAVYTAIAGGATGILAYIIGEPTCEYFKPKTRNSGSFASPETHIGFLQGICPELRALEDVLITDDVPEAVKADHGDILTLAKVFQGKHFLFVINPREKSLGRITIRPRTPAAVWKVLGENRQVRSRNGVFTDEFEPCAVHVYTDDQAFDMPVKIQAVQAKIDAVNKKYNR